MDKNPTPPAIAALNWFQKQPEEVQLALLTEYIAERRTCGRQRPGKNGCFCGNHPQGIKREMTVVEAQLLAEERAKVV